MAEYDQNNLEWLLRVFDRMHHTYLKSALEKQGLKVTHPYILVAFSQLCKKELES